MEKCIDVSPETGKSIKGWQVPRKVKMQFRETRFEFQMLSIHEQLSAQKRKSVFDKEEEDEEIYEQKCEKRNILKHLFQLF